MKQPIHCSTRTGTTLGYAQHGTGPTRVLVLHDWLGDHSSYNDLLPFLDCNAFTYVFADARGYGKSIEQTGEYTIEEMASDCLELVDQLGWARFHIIGHSMTGMLTQRLAANARSRVASAIAVCPVSAAGNRLSPEALAFFTSTMESDEALRRLLKFVSGGLCDGWVDRKIRQNRETVSPGSRAGYLEMLVTTHFVEDVRGLDTPFLVIVGDKDPGLDAIAMESTFLAWHPNAELQVFYGCGHYPMQESPPRFATVIENFLTRHST
ncbi:alpha/beta hydrolase [Pseudomonas nicosulfuronedens]|uniref:Alpha/beta hydrolase n=1 Tax=Pseudomonas nicosulfuronedens TaxID=2571105 RepID=A0A5R9QKU4_9PSED|nr:alpha/beta hydrolase [Pseudomonas nicosulfuronedens]TLX70029.1 alpha/beta hydrolase [Pseudomonas nicosulfuronedens]